MTAKFKSNSFSHLEKNYLTPITQILKDSLTLVENKRFEDLYNKFNVNSTQKGILTKLLYLAGFDPLAHMESIHPYMFFETDVESITIPGNIDVIEMGAFRNCSSLKEIVIPATVGSMKELVFLDCHALESVVFEEGSTIPIVGLDAFKACYKLTNVKLPKSLKSISAHMFEECTALERIEVPEGVEQLSRECFKNCTHLTDVHVPDSVKRIGQNAFRGCRRLAEIELPRNLNIPDPDKIFPKNTRITRR